jgi:hypothetical protein
VNCRNLIIISPPSLALALVSSSPISSLRPKHSITLISSHSYPPVRAGSTHGVEDGIRQAGNTEAKLDAVPSSRRAAWVVRRPGGWLTSFVTGGNYFVCFLLTHDKVLVRCVLHGDRVPFLTHGEAMIFYSLSTS